MNIKFLAQTFKRFNNRVKTHGKGRYLYCWTDYIVSAFLYGSSPDDYFRYEFYNKTHDEKNEFITYRRSRKLIKELNKEDKINNVLDKASFNKYFRDFIVRKWLDPQSSNRIDFEKFIREHKSVIVKPLDGGSGRGIWKYDFKDTDNLEEVYNNTQGNLIEEVIQQHPIMNELNPTSVNTVRVFTINDGSSVNIIACSLRTGSGGSIIDNLHSGGMSAAIDIEKGIVFTNAINANLERFENHPSTNVKFRGFEIPNWEQAISTVKLAAKKIPELRYVGWDIAILNDGAELIEANHDPAHDLIQINDQIGKFNLVKKYAY